MGTRPPSVLFDYAVFLILCGCIGVGLTGFHGLQHIFGLRPAAGILLLGLVVHQLGRNRLLAKLGVDLSMVLIVILGLNYARLSYKWYQLGEPHQYYFLVAALAAMGSVIAFPMLLRARLTRPRKVADESPKVPQVSLVTAAVDLFGLAPRNQGIGMIRRLRLPLGLVLLAVGFIVTISSRQPGTLLAGGMESEAVAQDHERLIRQLQAELERRQNQLTPASAPPISEESPGDAGPVAATTGGLPAVKTAGGDQYGPKEVIGPETLVPVENTQASQILTDDRPDSAERLISALQRPLSLDAINVFSRNYTADIGMNAGEVRQLLQEFADDLQQAVGPAVEGRARAGLSVGWSDRSMSVREMPGRINTRVNSKINSRVPSNRISWRIGSLRINGQSGLRTHGLLQRTLQVPSGLLPSAPADISADESLESSVWARGIARITPLLAESHSAQPPQQPRPHDRTQQQAQQVQQEQPQPSVEVVTDVPALDEALTVAGAVVSTEIASQPISDDEPLVSNAGDLRTAPAHGRAQWVQIESKGVVVAHSKWLTHLAGPACILAGLLAVAASFTRRSMSPHPI